jgi:hypothetical protein
LLALTREGPAVSWKSTIRNNAGGTPALRNLSIRKRRMEILYNYKIAPIFLHLILWRPPEFWAGTRSFDSKFKCGREQIRRAPRETVVPNSLKI